jgi:hypothetical protein
MPVMKCEDCAATRWAVVLIDYPDRWLDFPVWRNSVFKVVKVVSKTSLGLRKGLLAAQHKVDKSVVLSNSGHPDLRVHQHKYLNR